MAEAAGDGQRQRHTQQGSQGRDARLGARQEPGTGAEVRVPAQVTEWGPHSTPPPSGRLQVWEVAAAPGGPGFEGQKDAGAAGQADQAWK